MLIEQKEYYALCSARIIAGRLEELQRDKKPNREEWMAKRLMVEGGRFTTSASELDTQAGEREAILLAEEITADALLRMTKTGARSSKRSRSSSVRSAPEASRRAQLDRPPEAIDR